MKCRRVQDLLSPYLDGRLTGQQMLDVREHMEKCSACHQEFLAIRQVKSLLRSLAVQNTPTSLEERISLHVTQEAFSPAFIRNWNRQQYRHVRGRRLATAMALSCVSILSVAVPFGASTLQIAYSHPHALARLEDGLRFLQLPQNSVQQASMDSSLFYTSPRSNTPKVSWQRVNGGYLATLMPQPVPAAQQFYPMQLSNSSANNPVMMADFTTH